MRTGLAAMLTIGLTVAALTLPAGAQEAPPQSAAQPQLPPPDDQNMTEPALPPEEAPAPRPTRVKPPPEETPDAPPPKPPEPLKRTRHDAAILQATDKITAGTLRFEARVGQPVRFKDLVITVRACETTAADEPVADAVASLDVVSQPTPANGRRTPEPRQVYRGWMFANSPSLHPLEHPVYNLTLIACRTVSASTPSAKP